MQFVLSLFSGLVFSVNVMAMDYCPAHTGNMCDHAIAAGKALFAYLQERSPSTSNALVRQRIEITPMIGVNDMNTEWFTLSDARVLSIFARQQGLGPLSLWALGRDKPCADAWSSPTCRGKNLQICTNEFSKTFIANLKPQTEDRLYGRY